MMRNSLLAQKKACPLLCLVTCKYSICGDIIWQYVVCCLIYLYLCVDLDITFEGSNGRDPTARGAVALKQVLIILSIINSKISCSF